MRSPRHRRATAVYHSAVRLSLLAATFAAGRGAMGATKTWLDTDGLLWSNTAAWSPTGVPVNGDDVLVGEHTSTSGTPTLIYSSTYTGAGLNSLTISATAVTAITFNQNAGSAMLATTELIGDATGTNTYTQTNGTNTGKTITLGNATGGEGIYNLSGSASVALAANMLIVGSGGTGTINQNGGTVSITGANGSLTVGAAPGGSGAYNLNSGNLTVGTVSAPGQLIIGADATDATFTQTGGATTLIGTGNTLTLGQFNDGAGAYLLKGGSLSADVLTVGSQGSGNMTQSGGSVTVTNLSANSGLTVGYAAGGSYTLNSANANASLTATHESIGNFSAGSFNQSGNTSNFITGILAIGGDNGGDGFYTISAGTLTANTAIVGSSAAGGGSGSVIQSGSALVTIQPGGLTITPTGSYTLNGGTLVTPATSGGFVVSTNGTFTQSGGAYSGYLLNSGTVTYTGGTFSGTLENTADGDVNPAIPFIVNGALLNRGDILLSTGSGIGSGTGGSFDNEGSLDLQGGSLLGAAGILNNGGINGFGNIAGSGGFTNNGSIDQGAGALTISNTGTNINAGFMTLAAGRQMQLSGASLNNNASLLLNGAIINGNGTLINNFAGLLVGPGTITAALQNSGTIVPSGTLVVAGGWTNGGVVQMTGAATSLVGGTINNTGTINGSGTIAAAVNSSGTLEAMGGTLVFTGSVANTGTLRAAAGTKLLMQSAGSFSVNAGLIDLAGGTFDNGGHALDNTGTIAGYGLLAASSITNDGAIVLADGAATINANIINSANKRIDIKYQPALFVGNITNGGTIKTWGTTVTYTGTLTNLAGSSYSSDPATNIFLANVNSAGTMTGGVGDVFNLSNGAFSNSGTFTNGGTLTSSDNVTNSGTFTQTGPQNWSAGATFTNTAGTAIFGTDAGSASAAPLAILLTGGTVNLAATQHLSALTISAGTAAITSGTTKTNALTLAGSPNNWTSALALNGNKLVVETTAGTKAADLLTLENQAEYGLAHSAGITSSGLAPNLALAVIDNGALATRFTTFGGVSVDANSILVAPELLGDANVDGVVNLADLTTVLQNLGSISPAWTSGNFDHAGRIDLTDLDTVLNNLGSTYAGSSSVMLAESLLGSATSAPEPGSLAMIGGGIPLLLRKRRRLRYQLGV